MRTARRRTRRPSTVSHARAAAAPSSASGSTRASCSSSNAPAASGASSARPNSRSSSREEEGREVGLRRFVPLAPGKELPRQVLLAAAIVIDVCATHGVWLDAGELVLVMNCVRSRSEGDVAPTSEEFSEAEWLRRSEVEQAYLGRSAVRDGQRAPRHGPGAVEPIGGERSYPVVSRAFSSNASSRASLPC
jgi:Zn-finger nucleic acid-binding protein